MLKKWLDQWKWNSEKYKMDLRIITDFMGFHVLNILVLVFDAIINRHIELFL